MGENLPKEVNNWVRNVFWDCFLLRQPILTHKWRGICCALYIWEGEKCVRKIFLNLSKYSLPKSESARTWENLGSFSFPPNALILTLEATFSFREIKRRDGDFHHEWPLVSFWLGGWPRMCFLPTQASLVCTEEILPERILNPDWTSRVFAVVWQGRSGDRLWENTGAESHCGWKTGPVRTLLCHLQRRRTDGAHLKPRVSSWSFC